MMQTRAVKALGELALRVEDLESAQQNRRDVRKRLMKAV